MTAIIVLAVLVISSIFITVLVLYAIGKIRNIEELTNQLMARAGEPAAAEVDPNSPFAGLDGKALWDMLAGRSVPPGVAAAELEGFRKKYAPILSKAIKMVCADGQSDGQFGNSRSTPKNERSVKTLRNTVMAWLPSHEVSGLYNAAYDSARAEGDDLVRVRMSLEELSSSLFSKLHIAMPSGFLDSLQLRPGAEEAEAVSEDSIARLSVEQKSED
jgi:hypothetical protein